MTRRRAQKGQGLGEARHSNIVNRNVQNAASTRLRQGAINCASRPSGTPPTSNRPCAGNWRWLPVTLGHSRASFYDPKVEQQAHHRVIQAGRYRGRSDEPRVYIRSGSASNSAYWRSSTGPKPATWRSAKGPE